MSLWAALTTTPFVGLHHLAHLVDAPVRVYSASLLTSVVLLMPQSATRDDIHLRARQPPTAASSSCTVQSASMWEKGYLRGTTCTRTDVVSTLHPKIALYFAPAPPSQESFDVQSAVREHAFNGWRQALNPEEPVYGAALPNPLVSALVFDELPWQLGSFASVSLSGKTTTAGCPWVCTKGTPFVSMALGSTLSVDPPSFLPNAGNAKLKALAVLFKLVGNALGLGFSHVLLEPRAADNCARTAWVYAGLGTF